MATETLYLAKCKACGTSTSALVTAEQFRAVQLHACWPETHPKAATPLFSKNGSLMLDCRVCGQRRFAKPVVGKTSHKHQCGAKCMASKGPSCECSCGGKNHGASYERVA